MMKKVVRSILSFSAAAILAVLAMVSPVAADTALANDEVLDTDFKYQGYPLLSLSDRLVRIRAGESKEIELFARFNYTYYMSECTSYYTYCECNWKAGTSKPVLHIGADEQAKSVTFYFYIDDEQGLKDTEYEGNTELYGAVQVYVEPAAGANAAAAAVGASATDKSTAVTMAKGAAGTLSLISNDTIAMLYDKNGTALASFSISDGTGNMPKLTTGAVTVQGGKNYFTINTKKKTETTIKISASDKTVMTKKGFAGVCLNGTCQNWP